MADRDEPASVDSDRIKPSVRHLAGKAAGSPAAKKLDHARRNPTLTDFHDTSPRWLRKWAGWSWRLVIGALAIALVFYSTGQVLLVFIAVFLALVFTAVLRPMVNSMSKRMPRQLATGLSMFLSFVVIVGLFAYIGLSVAGQWEDLGKQFNAGIITLLQYLEDSPLNLSVTTEDVQGWLDSAQRWVSDNSNTIATQALSSAGSVAQMFAAIALATFCTVFFLHSGREMWEWFLNQVPAHSRKSWYKGGNAAWSTFSGYTRGTFIVAGVDGVLALILLLALDVPLAAPLAVLVFIGAFIPLIGAPAAMIVAMIVALAANGLPTAIAVGIGIALIGQFEGHILTPLVMGKQVSLHPVVIALTVTAGTIVGGILGAVIAVPLVSVAWAVFSKLRWVDPPTDLETLKEETEAESADETEADADSEPEEQLTS